MEGNTKKSRIVEWNGLPGCGKSTTVRTLKQLLEKKGEKVFVEYYRAQYHRKAVSFLFAPKYWGVLAKAFMYCKGSSIGIRLKLVVSMISFVRTYHNFCKYTSDEILLIDQGIIQSFISMAYACQLDNLDGLGKLLKLFRLNDLPLAIVNCNIASSVSNERISIRQGLLCRLDSINEKDRQELLDIQNNNFTIIRDFFQKIYPNIPMVNIDSLNSPEYNANYIINILFH